MEYNKALQRIIEVEARAREIVANAREKESKLEADLAAEIERLRKKYERCSDERIRIVREEEKGQVKRELAELEENYRKSLEELESSFASNAERWKEQCLKFIVGEERGASLSL